jgi:predicted ester cyclase
VARGDTADVTLRTDVRCVTQCRDKDFAIQIAKRGEWRLVFLAMKNYLYGLILMFGIALAGVYVLAAPGDDDQKVVLRYFHEVLDGRNPDLVESLFQPDYVIHFASGDIRGNEGLRGMVEGIKATYSKMASEVHDIFRSNDKVVVRLTHRAIGAGPMRTRIGTTDVKGKDVVWDATVMFRMRDGKIAEEWVTRDELGALLSAGILKAKQ